MPGPSFGKHSKLLVPALYTAAMLLVVIYVWNSQIVIRRASSAGLFRNLMEYPAYVRRGFDPAEIRNVPGVQEGGPWYRFAAPPLRIMDSPLPDLPRRPFLSPLGRDAEEFTILIALEMDGEAMAALREKPAGGPGSGNLEIVPGLFFAFIGDNWEIYLNGTLLRRETHLSESGKITAHRAWRDVYFPVEKALLLPGTNALALRIIGDPADVSTGLYYNTPYYLDDFRNIEKRNQPFLLLFFSGLFAFTSLYHLMLFLSIKPRREIFNLFFSFLSMSLCGYTIVRNGIVNFLIPEAAVSVRLEYACVFMMSSLMGLFFESYGRQKLTPITRGYFVFCLFLSVSQVFFCPQYGFEVMRIWNVSAMMYFSFVFFYDIVYFSFKSRRSGTKSADVPMTNIVVGASVVYFCGIYDLLDIALFQQSFNLFQYGFFVVTTGIAFTLSNRFSGLYNRLGEANATLESAVRERTVELEKQTEIALNASRAKSEFLATMSHEIRTPLNAVIGLSEIELRGNLPPSSKNNVEQIYQSGSSLLAIVNDILDISKIEAGSFELVPVEYETAPFVNGTVRLNIVRIGSKPISFVLEIGADFPRRLRGDELRVRQILNNLLSNAIKYTKEGSVTLSAAWEKREKRGSEALLRFTVRDTGMGIRREDLDKLFSDYTQLDTKANRKIEGTGLGLAITKKLVEMMGGLISVESEYGRGSAFTVEIPQGLADETPIGDETAGSLRTFRYTGPAEERNILRTPMPYGKVLVVDDMAVNLQVARGLLEPYGLTIDTASSGPEAIEKIRREDPRYDLVFMDHMMPGMDGVEAVRRIRGDGGPRSRELPIIALTANALAGMKEMFLENGFNGFISKPIDAAQLDEALNRWVRRGEASPPAPALRAFAAPLSGGSTPATPPPGGKIPPGPPIIPGVDTAKGIAMTGGTIEGYRKVLALFRQDALERLPLLQTPPEPEALPLFTTQVHALKSAAASIGAAEVSAEAAALETAGKAGDSAAIAETLPPFAEHLAALVQEIRAALMDGIENGEWKMESAKEPLAILNSQHSILNSLAAALEAQNAGDTDTLLEELGKQTLDAKTRETIEQVSDQVLMADYGAALGILKALLMKNTGERE